MKMNISPTILMVLCTATISANAENFVDPYKLKPYDENAYSECILKNTKPNMSSYAVAQISEACRIKAVPKKCRDMEKVDTAICVYQCKSASWSSRKYGECATED
jgi:hypothetical protein